MKKAQLCRSICNDIVNEKLRNLPLNNELVNGNLVPHGNRVSRIQMTAKIDRKIHSFINCNVAVKLENGNRNFIHEKNF